MDRRAGGLFDESTCGVRSPLKVIFPYSGQTTYLHHQMINELGFPSKLNVSESLRSTTSPLVSHFLADKTDKDSLPRGLRSGEEFGPVFGTIQSSNHGAPSKVGKPSKDHRYYCMMVYRPVQIHLDPGPISHQL